MGPPRFHPASLFFPFFFLFSFFRRFASLPAASAASSTCSLPARVIFLLALSSLGSAVNTAGWTVRPSNNSGDLSWTGGLRFLLNSTQVHLPTSVRLAPLTQALVDLNQAELAQYLVSGTLLDVDATNSLSLSRKDIAVISCDPSAYPGNLDASSTLGNVLTAQQQALAVILYSGTSLLCNYTTDEPSANRYINVFTLVNPTLNRQVQSQLEAPGNGTTYIGTNMSYLGPTATTQDQTESSGSPNTAMIILYSITGIITALFLAIIITGAVRAHRHPERYGPRYTAGRPRQSRARGIARAMLDTIPIVRFGDNNQPDGKTVGPKGDVEMGSGLEVPANELEERDVTTTAEVTSPHQPQTEAPPTESQEEKRSDAPATETTTDHPNFSCPICTDDFVKGQDLRVLPCNHQFHPECIDPWLVNVSGTCPLCRIDLNPPQQEGEEEQDLGDGQPETAEGAAEATTESGHGRHRRISNYLHGTLNARRMRDASVEERLAALRSVREEANREEAADEADEQRMRRRSRLTTRLREKFRVRTRAHGEAVEASSSNEAPPA
ncbi:RING-H2 finger protein [Aspergillus vadensis CBS 113365]|uniref:RING finger domain protein n=1 Tax=Aspergillus vadensis (strain CBS 113365 / IMI 142717 / IBT 24658) TaxID=1448311 RepID=A0A319C9V2_ASPVC|nr:RING finger domain protein [Aspergillus vadensis CBS 113365]PYH72138.1 RING finger domain protein [Aspergillus vadensis CBS 113365]